LLFAYVESVAYPKKNPKQVNKSAGISLPADMKAKLAKKAASQHRSLSSVAQELLRKWLEEVPDELEKAGQRNLQEAKASLKKRR
jgi:plasmid stability protein